MKPPAGSPIVKPIWAVVDETPAKAIDVPFMVADACASPLKS